MTRFNPATIDSSFMVSAWFYLRREMLYLAWAIMEVALLTPLYLALMPWARFWPPGLVALLLLLLMLLPFNLSRVMSLVGMPVNRQRQWMALALLITILTGLRLLLYGEYGLFDWRWLAEFYGHFAETGNPFWGQDVVVFFLITITWGRGITLTGRDPYVEAIGLRLRVLGLLIAPLIIAIASVRLSFSIAPFILLFFLAALMAVALGRAEEIELERSGRSFPMSPYWIGAIFAASLSVVLVSGLLAILVSGRYIPAAIAWLQPVWTAANFAFTTLVATVSYILFPLFILSEKVILLLRLWLSRLSPVDLTPTPEQQPEGLPEDYYQLLLDAAAALNEGGFTRWPVVVLAVIVILLVIFSLERLFRRSRGFSDQEGARAPQNPDSSRRSGRGVVQRLRDEMERWRRWRAAVSVRRIYQQMCRAAAVYGYTRQESETPYEYLNTLSRAWPQGTAESRLITQAYVRVRYGQIPETAEELAAIRAAWNRLEQARPEEQT